MSRSLALAAAAALCLALAASAQAQIPNPLRRAKEKAGQVLTGQQPAQGGAIKFDAVMLELSAPVLDRVVLGLRTKANHKGTGGRSAAALRRRAQELTEEAAKINQDRAEERTDFVNRLGNARNCAGEVLSGIERQHAEAMQRRFTSMVGANLGGDASANAKFMAEFQKLTMEISAAAIAQDTARAHKAQAAYNKLMGIDPKADSAKANAQCNVPAPPAWMARADAADAESNRLYNEARELEAAGNAAAVQVSGMQAEQFAMAVERIAAFVAVKDTDRGLWKFSRGEEEAITARLAVLRPLIG